MVVSSDQSKSDSDNIELPDHIQILIKKLSLISELSESKVAEALVLVGIEAINRDKGLFRYFTNLKNNES